MISLNQGVITQLMNNTVLTDQNRIEQNHIFSAKTSLNELNDLQYCLHKEKD